MDQEKKMEHSQGEPVKKRPVRYDENGNPIPPKKRPVRYDENGNPIPPKKRPVRYDENGNPIPPKKRPVRYDENGNPIPPKKRPVRYDENGNPIPPKKQPVREEEPLPKVEEEEQEAAQIEKPEREAEEKAEPVRRLKDVKNPSDQTKKSDKRSDGKNKTKYVGIGLSALQGLASVVLFAILLMVDMLPTKYLVVIGIMMAVFLAFTILSQCSKAGKKVGWVFALILSVLFMVGSVYIWKAHSVIDEVTTEQPTTQLSDVSIVVMADSPAKGLIDLKGKKFGVQKIIDRENTEETLVELEKKMNYHVTTVEYESLKSQVQALYNGDVEAIVINEVYRSMIQEDFKDFNTKTRVLDAFTYEREVKKKPAKADIKVDTESFNVFLSGNDAYGKVTLANGRSDVNIIATVNPKTKTILLTTTPRDYYIMLPNGHYDKLTHAGLYGIETSMETLEDLYGIQLDYYVRVNFSGFQDIVDALGGVDVNSKYEFSAQGFYYEKGMNHLNGEAALAFVRERYTFADGDFQRGRNQMLMIEAMMNKILSSAILTNYMDLMDSVSTCFITDMPRDKINDLVKMQLNDGAKWTILSNSVMGYGNMRSTYSGGSEPLSVVDPDQGDVELASKLIQQCMDGEKVVIPDKKEAGIYTGSSIGSIGLNPQTESSLMNSQSVEMSSTVTIDPESSVNSSENSGGGMENFGSQESSDTSVPEINSSAPVVDPGNSETSGESSGTEPSTESSEQSPGGDSSETEPLAPETSDIVSEPTTEEPTETTNSMGAMDSAA